MGAAFFALRFLGNPLGNRLVDPQVGRRHSTALDPFLEHLDLFSEHLEPQEGWIGWLRTCAAAVFFLPVAF